MALVVFWINIAVKRIVRFVKISPVIVIGAAIIIYSLIVTRKELIIRWGTYLFITITSIFALVSLLLSLKKCNTVSRLILYSKSNVTNKIISIYFFIGRAFVNNIPLLLCNFIIATGIIKMEHGIYMPIITVFSIMLSCAVIIARNKYIYKKASNISTSCGFHVMYHSGNGVCEKQNLII
jgi:hypothetical protein